MSDLIKHITRMREEMETQAAEIERLRFENGRLRADKKRQHNDLKRVHEELRGALYGREVPRERRVRAV